MQEIKQMTLAELIQELSITPTFSSRCVELLNEIERIKNIIWVNTSLYIKGHYENI